ncbi:MAG: HAD hydrolase-like protein [Candidatus Woesearchaeota archaeon]|nr:HAD hydrolase-like protein [Candidatus Woesearchaeota archaeon]
MSIIIKGVIFDYDGVIVDSFKDQFRMFKKLCKIKGIKFPYRTPEELRENYVEPFPAMYEKIGFNWKRDRDEIYRLYRQYKEDAEIGIVKGIDRVVMELAQNYKLGIASSNSRLIIMRSLTSNNIEHCFSAIVTEEDLKLQNPEPRFKPDPDSIIITLEKMELEPEETVYVGDQPTDAVASMRVAEFRGKAVHPVLVSYGYAAKDKLKNAIDEKYIADSPEDIIRIIKNIEKEIQQ